MQHTNTINEKFSDVQEFMSGRNPPVMLDGLITGLPSMVVPACNDPGERMTF